MDVLKQLGLNGYESAIYEALLKYGRSDARQLSEHSKVPPTAVYPNLKSLVQKGLIQQFEGEISEYEAIKPSIAVKNFIEKKIDDLKELEEVGIPELDHLRCDHKVLQKTQVVSLSHGVDASVAITKEFISKVRKSLYILGWRASSGHKYTLIDELKKLKGFDVRIIITRTPVNQELIKAYKRIGIKVKYYPLQNFSVIIKDGNSCKITLKSPEVKERFNILIKDEDLSSFLNQYFLTIWEKSEEIK
ncbi:hypothetical protein HZA97_10000 [Candidatus Woesearchaeota archaeon]|nr:hypothetical protein [Candidatus Woesearchaeota archaeon]